MQLQDLVGQRFTYLLILYRDSGPNPRKRPCWKCLCNCGNFTWATGSELRRGFVKSCGCRIVDLNRSRATYMPIAFPAEYCVWNLMKSRCHHPHNKSYINYGGRGITICERWFIFGNFLADVGPRPSPKHTLERKNNDLGYSPENCIWATRKEQARNKRNTRRILFNGEWHILATLAEQLNVPIHTLLSRRKRLKLAMTINVTS